jgi:hypothetical protein
MKNASPGCLISAAWSPETPRQRQPRVWRAEQPWIPRVHGVFGSRSVTIRRRANELGETERGVGAAALIEAASRSWVKVELHSGGSINPSRFFALLGNNLVDFVRNESHLYQIYLRQIRDLICLGRNNLLPQISSHAMGKQNCVARLEPWRITARRLDQEKSTIQATMTQLEPSRPR